MHPTQSSPIRSKSGTRVRIKTWINIPVPAIKPHETEVLPRGEGFIELVLKFIAKGGLVGRIPREVGFRPEACR